MNWKDLDIVNGNMGIKCFKGYVIIYENIFGIAAPVLSLTNDQFQCIQEMMYFVELISKHE